jgi:tRNA-specific 2-thiouridylase
MKAIILLSGGLDSTLAAELMSREGLELLAVNFKTPFCLCDRHSSNLGCGSNALRVAEALGIDLKIINATKDFLEVLKKPAHGYGANMNPCIDCRILFFRKSKELMEEVGASFIITGEVLGQRPMSQFRRQMNIIEKEADLEGLLCCVRFRPSCWRQQSLRRTDGSAGRECWTSLAVPGSRRWLSPRISA